MEQQTITVRGTARRRVSPDVATWSAAVEARAKTQRDAFAKCSAALATLTATVKAAAADGAEVWTSGIFISQEWDEQGKLRPGYVGTGSVSIRADLDEAGRLGQAALDAGAIRLDGPTFEIRDVTDLRDELAAEAVTAARITAERMAAAAGKGVGEALAISDGVAAPPTWGPQPRMMARAASMEMSAADAPPLEPGAQEIHAAAVVTFALVAAATGSQSKER